MGRKFWLNLRIIKIWGIKNWHWYCWIPFVLFNLKFPQSPHHPRYQFSIWIGYTDININIYVGKVRGKPREPQFKH